VIAVDAGVDANTVKADVPPLRMLVGVADSVTVTLEDGVGVAVAVGVGVGVGPPEELKAL
jgi:hypothetical protein